MTVQYLDENCGLKSRVLYPANFIAEKNAGENIRRKLQRGVTDCGMDPGLLKNTKFVTEQGANNPGVLHPCTWVSCAGYILNSVLQHALHCTTALLT